MLLPPGRPQLRVLPVSGAVRQRWPPDPAGRAAENTEWTRGSRGEAAGEESTRAGERSACQSARQNIGEGRSNKSERKRPGTTEHPKHTAATGYRSDVVSAVAGRLSGGAGPGGTDSVSLQHWLLRFGAARGELRLIVAEFGEWPSNGRPPRAAYHAMMSGRLIVLEKIIGIRLVGIGETWRRLLAKCLLRVTGQEAKAACRTEQLAGGVEAGVEGAIHAARLQWAQHSHE